MEMIIITKYKGNNSIVTCTDDLRFCIKQVPDIWKLGILSK